MWWKKRRIYLDLAAGMSGNPSSPHEEGRKSKEELERARAAIARLAEVQADDVIFTSGATEANALAILSFVRPGAHLLYLPSAHASIVENMKLAAERGARVDALPIRDYRVDTDALAKLIRPETALVSIEAVCGETGVVWNTREVAQVLRKHRRGNDFLAPSGLVRTSQPVASKIISPSVLHVDASQAPLTEKITRAHFAADLLTLDASKIGTVRGIGALLARRTTPLIPLYRGGGQERGLRSGSEAPELATRFARALEDVVRGREEFRRSAERDRVRLIEAIMKSVPKVYVQEGKVQAPHIVNLALPGSDTDYLVALLDDAGYAVSTKSACETDSVTGSRAVFALTGDPRRAFSTLRVSWGPGTRLKELLRFSEELARAVAFIDNKSGG